MLGWRHLETILKEAGYNPDEDYLFSDSRCITSMLCFYGPQQKRAYYLNLKNDKSIENQYSIWPGIEEEQQGKRGFYIIALRNLSIHAESIMIESLRRDLKKTVSNSELSRCLPPLSFLRCSRK